MANPVEFIAIKQEPFYEEEKGENHKHEKNEQETKSVSTIEMKGVESFLSVEINVDDSEIIFNRTKDSTEVVKKTNKYLDGVQSVNNLSENKPNSPSKENEGAEILEANLERKPSSLLQLNELESIKMKAKGKPECANAVFPCGLCKLAFTSPSYLKSHLKHCYARRKGKSRQTINSTNENCTINSKGKKKRITHTHDKSQISDDFVDNHVLTHTDPFICDICNFEFTRKSSLKLHLKTHYDEKNSSKVCGHTFRQTGNLERHIRTNSHEKSYNCDVCDYKCFQSSHLARHMRTHTREKHYSCDVKQVIADHVTEHIRDKNF